MAALSEIAKYVRPDVPGCPDIMILDAILRAGIEFCKRTRTVKEDLTITTILDIPDYVLNTSAGTVVDEVLSVARGQYENLDPSTHKEFEQEGYNKIVGTPQYFYLKGDNTLVLGNIPVGVEDLDVVVKIRPAEDATVLPDEIVNRYKYELASGAKSILMLMSKQPWTDIQMATVHRGLFEDAIATTNLREAKGASRKPLRVVGQYF